ncbi:Dna2/Cas4 domain-containing protein [Cetobacterium ceti]
MFDNTINIDFVDKWKVIHEVKKDKTMEDASIWQIKYYFNII